MLAVLITRNNSGLLSEIKSAAQFLVHASTLNDDVNSCRYERRIKGDEKNFDSILFWLHLVYHAVRGMFFNL
jgi:hypothetical protein